MKKCLSSFVILLILVFTLIGCSSNAKAARGIRTVGDYTCYQIDLQGGTVEDYFTPVKPKGQVSVALNGELGQGSAGIVANYSKISEGGWIAYYKNLVIYLPADVSETSVQVTCAAFRSLDSSDCFTVDEAQEYLPWLN